MRLTEHVEPPHLRGPLVRPSLVRPQPGLRCSSHIKPGERHRFAHCRHRQPPFTRVWPAGGQVRRRHCRPTRRPAMRCSQLARTTTGCLGCGEGAAVTTGLGVGRGSRSPRLLAADGHRYRRSPGVAQGHSARSSHFPQPARSDRRPRLLGRPSVAWTTPSQMSETTNSAGLPPASKTPFETSSTKPRK